MIVRESSARRILVTVYVEIDEDETRIVRASLRDIPEIDFATAKVRPNPYAARIAREGIEIQVGRGRPKRLLEVGVKR